MRKKVLLLSALLLWEASPLGAAMQKASFLPQWSPQAQFAGYYVAYEKGLYRKNGIDLTILQGGSNQPPHDYLEGRKADFVSAWLAAAIQKRSQGVKLVNIGQVVQRSALMLVAKKSSNIRTPRDMQGKKVGLWEGDFQIQPKAFFKKYNLRVNVIPQSFSVNLFLRGGVDVASAMWYNEYHTILNAGINPDELSTFFFHESGLNFPEDGIYTLETTFRQNPSLATAFVRASLEGWQYAFAHPDEALTIVLAYISRARIPANRMHQKWMLARMKDIISPPNRAAPPGVLQPSDYARVAHELRESGLINKIPDYHSFFVRWDSHAEK
ncbi:MAG: ABC transporter substrate-binding protein [Deltaproteobacteria bacterium]|nr:ABC transporter substrate-binding protein [Deltaproteobacteria bacterium]